MPTCVYHTAKLSRFDLGVVRSPGPGLGNLLMPVGRALIAADRTGGRFVYPTLPQLKFGPLMRFEHDTRMYWSVIRPRRGVEWRDWWAAKRGKAIAASDWESKKAAEYDALEGERPVCVTHEGMGQLFHDLEGGHEVLAPWLHANVRDSQAICSAYDIAVHVRLGDFTAADAGADGTSVRQDFAWYRAALAAAADICREAEGGGSEPTVRVFTDATPSKVAAELGLQRCEIDASPNALVAMINMSKARVVVASRSTFSMWGVFLGGTHAVWQRHFNVGKYMPVRAARDHFI